VEVRETRSARVAGALRDTVKVRLDIERFQQVQQRALVYQGGLVLAPGNYRLKFLARENETGRIGTFEHELVLPRPQPDRLELSSLMLSSQLQALRKESAVEKQAFAADAKLKNSPLELAGERIIPSVTRVFTTQQKLYVFFQAYIPPGSDGSRLRAGLVFYATVRSATKLLWSNLREWTPATAGRPPRSASACRSKSFPPVAIRCKQLSSRPAQSRRRLPAPTSCYACPELAAAGPPAVASAKAGRDGGADRTLGRRAVSCQQCLASLHFKWAFFQ
jgi:hypothetical protein